MKLSMLANLALILGLAVIPAAAQPPVTITVDAAHPVGPYHPIWNNFGADEPNYSYTPNGAQLLRELAAIAPGTPVSFRPHNLLTSGDGTPALKWGSTGVYSEAPDGSPLYNWTITDRLFDNLAATHVRPLVEIGFMPQALSPHPTPYQHDFPKGDVFTGWSYPPNNYAKWRNLIVAWVTHMHARYGPIVDTWQWEVWNEPDIGYFHGSPEDYFKLYDITTAAVQQVIPGAAVGGPSVTGGGQNKHFLQLFLEHCARGTNADTGQKGAPLDFISFHPKGSPKFIPAALPGQAPGGPGVRPDKRTGEAPGAPRLASETWAGPPQTSTDIPAHVRMNLSRQLQLTDIGFQTIAAFPEYRNTPILLTETDPEGCAACKGPQNGYRNSPLYGVSVAEMLVRSAELASKRGVNLAGAITWAFEFDDQPPFAGFRELATTAPLTTGGSTLIDKPVLSVFREFGLMDAPASTKAKATPTNLLPFTSTAALPLDQLITPAPNGLTDIYGFATRHGNTVDVLVFNYADEDLPAPATLVALEVTGFPNKPVKVTQYLMDQNHANAYTVWHQMGSPQSLTPEQATTLKQASALTPLTTTRLKPQNGTLTLATNLPRQAVTLYHLTW